MDKNRGHGKIDDLPEDIRREIESKLLEGCTYKGIEKFLKDRGYDISYSAAWRFGNPFLKKFESVRMAKEFAQHLAEDNAIRPTTELHEANNALISQIVMEALVDEKMPVEEKMKAAKSVAILQQAQVQNERLKIVSRKEAGAVKTAMNMLKEKIYEEMKNYPEVAEAVIRIADEVEKQVQAV